MVVPSFISSVARRYYLPLYAKFFPYVFLEKPKPEPGLESFFSSPSPSLISKNDVVVEVGANIGGLTLVLSRLAKKVYAFEPNPFAFHFLKRHCSKAAAKNIVVFNKALGSSARTNAKIFLPSPAKPSQSASLVHLKDVHHQTEEAGIEVVTLDEVVKEQQQQEEGENPTVLILDCEGSELDVLYGARERTLPQVRAVFVETHAVSTIVLQAAEVNTWKPVADFLGSPPFSFHIDRWIDGLGSEWVIASR
jgi:FkbM family methyltransferase